MKPALSNGAAAAAMLAVGIGLFALGVSTTLKASSAIIKKILSFYIPAGPLSGQITIAAAAWLVAWAILHKLWKTRDVNFQKVFAIVLVLILLGFLGGFPPLFEIFFEEYE